MLEADPVQWIVTLRRLVGQAEANCKKAQRLTGPERQQVLDDLQEDHRQLRAALARLIGEPEPVAEEREHGRRNGDQPTDDGVTRLQAAWADGQVVLWAGSSAGPASADELEKLLGDAGARAIGWAEHVPGVRLPDGRVAPGFTAPVDDVLGWLVGVGAGQLAPDAAPSLRWLGHLAAWGTDLVAQGRMVPSLAGEPASPGSGSGARAGTGRYRMRWVPAAVDNARLHQLATAMPGAVGALDPSTGAVRVCRAVLGEVVDAVCRAGASRLVSPATVPVARTRTELSEAVLAGFGGQPFSAAHRTAGELATDLDRWAAPVSGEPAVTLTIRLDPPDDTGGWFLHVDATLPKRGTMPVHKALGEPPPLGRFTDQQLKRLERLLPVLCRPPGLSGGAGHRGQVVLGGEEAWELMTATGPVLTAAGFDVRVPAYSPRRPAPRLSLHAEPIAAGPTQVGTQQLARVRWSVLVDDVELDAGDIRRLAAEARPMIKVGGGWVELDRADLDAAARALAERSRTTELSGAAILRHAVGLEGAPVVVGGEGWAADLIRGATDRSEPLPAPDGFVGRLRTYQAAARGWLAFLDRAGLGGILALDMGLGKTPVVLAHLLETAQDGPVLVIAPPAVLGNWAAEAARFTPTLRVHVHHGSERLSGADEVVAMAERADVVLSTYATAARDADLLAAVNWRRLVVDEAQTIKNPAGLTAQDLRRIPAQSRLALTGTPIENGLGDLWAILDFINPALVGERTAFVTALSASRGLGTNGQGDGGPAPRPAAGGAAGMRAGEGALRALNGLLVFRRTKAEPEIAAELPDKIDELDHCGMTAEQVGLYQAVLDRLLAENLDGEDSTARKGHVLAAITALKQICDHPAAYVTDDTGPLEGRSGKLTRLDELVEAIFANGERVLVFTHFARWGERLAQHLTKTTGIRVSCYHGGLTRMARDRMVAEFQRGDGPGALVLSIKAGGAGLNLTAASHVVLYDRWWNPAVEDQARDRAWRIGQRKKVICHRLVCPGTVDERVEEVVAGKRRIADLVLPASSSLGDLGPDQLRVALGLRPEALVGETDTEVSTDREEEMQG